MSSLRSGANLSMALAMAVMQPEWGQPMRYSGPADIISEPGKGTPRNKVKAARKQNRKRKKK